MTVPDPKLARQRESRSLLVAMWGNLFMGAAGIVAGIASNSNAIMIDGVFSLIGFTAAFLGRRISDRVHAGPDHFRPAGYAADEALFSTFRALSLLGLVLFAVSMAGKSIYNYLRGTPPEPLAYAPMIAYFAIIFLTCLVLFSVHRFAWHRTGKASDILKLESKAALFDGLITAAAGIGLGTIYYFQEGVLAPIAPIGDSIIVLLLCLTVLGTYFRDFRAGLGELAGVSAEPEHVEAAHRALEPVVAEAGGTVHDIAVTKLGRSFFVTVYYDPGRPVMAAEIDQLNLTMIYAVRNSLRGSDVMLFVTQYPRRWPDELAPA